MRTVTRQLIEARLAAQLEEWQGAIAELEHEANARLGAAVSDEVAARERASLLTRVETLRSLCDEVESRLDEMRQLQDDLWSQMLHGMEHNWRGLSDTLAVVKAHLSEASMAKHA